MFLFASFCAAFLCDKKLLRAIERVERKVLNQKERQMRVIELERLRNARHSGRFIGEVIE
jgi:hypothetical protein